MKTIIAGSRDIHDADMLEQAIEQSGFEITAVLSGCEKGVDKLGESWAEKMDTPLLSNGTLASYVSYTVAVSNSVL